jgi:hypothetical protein
MKFTLGIGRGRRSMYPCAAPRTCAKVGSACFLLRCSVMFSSFYVHCQELFVSILIVPSLPLHSDDQSRSLPNLPPFSGNFVAASVLKYVCLPLSDTSNLTGNCGRAAHSKLPDSTRNPRNPLSIASLNTNKRDPPRNG